MGVNRKLLIVAFAAALAGVGAAPAQPALKGLMREKLGHSQKIFEAVVTSDWASLELHTRRLQQLTNDPRWAMLRYPEFARHSAEFQQALDALHEAAAQRDLEKTPAAFNAMTLRCVECHRSLARGRIADAGR